ncbi:MAG: tetratricopeptide repeat protein [Gemmatimonadota bacterium]
MLRTSFALIQLFAICSIVLLAACRSGEDSMLRGDRYWADSNYIAALAEYRLAAARQRSSSAAAARVAHAYSATGQLDRARSTYQRLVEADSSMADQAVFDFVWLARTNLQRGDRYGAARAAEAALELRPGLTIPDMALTLARYYATIGNPERALRFYHRALETAAPELRPGLLYEVASLSERNGDCVAALPYFEAFTEQSADRDSVTEARYRMGTCGLERGRQARAAGQPEQALQLLAVTLELGAPQNLLDQAWFERGEALLALGRVAEAAAAFERVLELSGAGRTQFAARAQRRLNEIRAGFVP